VLEKDIAIPSLLFIIIQLRSITSYISVVSARLIAPYVIAVRFVIKYFIPVNRKNLFFAAIALIIGLRLLFVALIPTNHGVKYHLESLGDEPSHFNYVKYLFEKKSFPVQTSNYKTPGALIRNDVEYVQPPIYYLLGALGQTVGGGIYFCRILSFLFGLISLWLIALILKRIGRPPEEQAAGVIFCGLFPTHAYFTSLVSNDSMSWLVALLVTYLCMGKEEKSTHLGQDFSWRTTLMLSGLLGFGSLIKSSLLLFYPIVAACFIYSWFRRRNPAILVKMAVSLGLALAINIPWFIRNYIHYGSITGMSVLNGPEVSYPHLLTLQGFIIFIKTSIRYFWFPMQHIPISIYQNALGIIGAIILIVLILLAIRYIVKKKPLTYNHLLLLGIALITLAAYFQYNLAWGNREGRFLLPALSSIVFFIIVPINSALKSIHCGRLFFPAILFIGAWGYSYLLLTF
jgi:hypothetical protein